MPRGFERNIVWDNNDDPDKQPRYAPGLASELRQTAMAAQAKLYGHRPLYWSDYDLGFLASLRIKA